MATAEAPALTESTFTEYADNRGVTLKVDRDAGIIPGVKLLGKGSANNRSYAPHAVTEAASLYEGAAVYVNHGESLTGPRKYQDRLGLIKNARVQDGEVFGDLHFNPKHALAEAVIWDAEHSTEKVGFSHNVRAGWRQVGKNQVIEAIKSVQSVDLVSGPATTSTMTEQTKQDETMSTVTTSTLQEVTLEQFKVARPDLLKAIVSEQDAGDELTALKTERDALKAQVDAYETAKRIAEKRTLVEQKIAEAKIPNEAISDVFREQCLNAKDDAALSTIIEDRRSLVALHGGRPVSREQGAGDKFAEPAAKQGYDQGKAYADEQIKRQEAFSKK